MARLFNLATEGVNAKLAFHICFGNRFGRGPLRAGLLELLPGRARRRAPTSSCWSSPAASCPRSRLSASEFGEGRELGAGLIDVKYFYTETPEDVAQRIRRVLKYVRPEKLWVNPDCGFGWSPRYMCNQKMRALAAGAALARAEPPRARSPSPRAHGAGARSGAAPCKQRRARMPLVLVSLPAILRVSSFRSSIL